MSARDPERFHIEKSDIVHDLERLASGETPMGERPPNGRTVVSHSYAVTGHGVLAVERKTRQAFKIFV